MSVFSNLLGPKDFDGKVNKLFNFYKVNTKLVSLGLIKSSQQLKRAISSIAKVLDNDVNQLSYEEIKHFGEIFCTTVSRVSIAGLLGSSDLIERTGSILFERYPVMRTKTNAAEITKKLFDITLK